MEVIRVSYSSLGTYGSCERKFELDKLYPRVKRPAQDNYAADVGKALHAGYQHFLAHEHEDQAIWEFMKEFPYESEYMQSNNYRSFEAALSTLEQMFYDIKMTEYRLAEIKKPSGQVVPAVEVPFAIRFKGLEVAPCERYPEGACFEFIGYIDAIMQHRNNGWYRALDIKTNRMNLTDATPKYKFDTQQVPYGIVIEHIAGQPVESFEVLYLDCYIDLLEPAINLYPFMKSQADIQEWGLNKMIHFQRIAQSIGSDYFPRTENGCLFYNRPCRFLEVCQSRDRAAIMDWLTLGDTDFVVDDFEPWIIVDLEVG